MSFARGLKRRGRALIAPAVFLSVAAFFGWNVVKGGHGLLAYAQRQQLLKQAKADLAQAQGVQQDWQHRVAALGREHLDADMLDQQAREMLSLSNPNDIIVPYPSKDRLY